MIEWIEERIEIQSIIDNVITKYIPPHINIFYCFDGLILISFIFQFISGFLLTFYYIPNILNAYITSININVYIRSLHRWISNLILLFIILHLSRIYMTGGFKKPRELTWMSGSLLSFNTLIFGVSGYSLPWDQIGFWALQIVSAIPQIFDSFINPLGTFIIYSIRGNFNVGQLTLNRFYSIHTLFLPFIIIFLSLIHFILIRKQGISGPL